MSSAEIFTQSAKLNRHPKIDAEKVLEWAEDQGPVVQS